MAILLPKLYRPYYVQFRSERQQNLQAYTMELEAEVQKLKELNQELERKQAEIMEMQKNETPEMLKDPFGRKKRLCLRRTLTGPW